jgi:hypothetical protein
MKKTVKRESQTLKFIPVFCETCGHLHGRKATRRCVYCSTVFVVGTRGLGTKRRSDALFCRDACKILDYRKRKRQERKTVNKTVNT